MNLISIIKKHNFAFGIIFTLVLSFIGFISLFGPYSLNPCYTNWIFADFIDVQQNYLGWCYFRNGAWTFPIGLYDGLSYPFQTSIMNTDSIPLFAIFFKILSPILPKDFQYWGIWNLLCFMLQTLLGMLIIKKYTKNDFYGYVISILSGLCFIILPFFIMRALYQSTLVAQWLILLCILPIVYSKEISFKQKTLIFSLIGFLAGAIHPYILAMCGLIILIYSIYEITEMKNILPLIHISVFSIIAVITLYLVGVFNQEAFYTHNNLADMSFNLNGFFNSLGFCKFFQLKSVTYFQEEGFSYFGLGFLFLIFTVIINFLIKIKSINIISNIKKYKKEILAVLFLLIISIILALSPRITFGDKILFEIPLPDFVLNLWSVFRATGRFIWIANYILFILLLVYIVKNFSQKIILVLLTMAIMLQMVDIMPLRDKKITPSPASVYETAADKYDTELFNRLAAPENDIKYIVWDKFFYINTYPMFNVFSDIARWAKNRNIKLSCFYFARILNGNDTAYFPRLKNPKPDEVFVFYNYKFFVAATKDIPIQYHAYGYNDLIFARSVPVEGWETIEISP